MECPVCMEIYETPLLLPGCGHTLCKACCARLLTPDDFLTCPECRLVHKLAQGLMSLPKNVALAKAIDDYHAQQQTAPRGSSRMCEQHPLDEVSLFCKTCEKYICLKCFFSSTLRGKGDHSLHDVDTSEDAHGREVRLLEERKLELEDRRKQEFEYVESLATTKQKLQDLLDSKLSEIDKNKAELISLVKKAAAKVTFTLKGSVASDLERLEMAQQRSEKLVHHVSESVDQMEAVLRQDSKQKQDLKILKKAREDVENSIELQGCLKVRQPSPETFLMVQKFDTSLSSCLYDHKMALAYQTECPRPPNIETEDCIISATSAYIVVLINQSVRTKTVTLHYKESQYKGMSQKSNSTAENDDITKGVAYFIIKDLAPKTMYKIHAIAHNDIGSSHPSKEMWFRTAEEQPEIKVI